MALSKEESLRRRKRRQMIKDIRSIILFVLLAAAFFFRLNDAVLHIENVPSSYDVLRFFGGGAKPYVRLAENEISVSFIDVGQGDCELIMTGNYNILIDSGDVMTVDKTIGFLRSSGVKRLDIVIVTHPHDDHFGGMSEILKSFPVGTVIMPETDTRGSSYEKLVSAVRDCNITLRYAAPGERFVLGDNTFLDILAPLHDDYDEENNFSVVTRLIHGETSFLFTGDLEKLGELDLIDADVYLDSDVLKVGHHGSAGSSCAEFLERVTPSIAVFEAGEINYYGHPRSEVFDRLAAVGCEDTYSTANNGNVVIVSDGAELCVETEREAAYMLIQ